MCVFSLFVHECVVAHMYVCVIPQIILHTLFRKAEEKLKDGERILKEHENIDCIMAVSKNIYTTGKHNDSLSRKCSVHALLPKL